MSGDAPGTRGRQKKIVHHELTTLFDDVSPRAVSLAREWSWTTTVDSVYHSEKWTTGVRARANLGRADGRDGGDVVFFHVVVSRLAVPDTLTRASS